MFRCYLSLLIPLFFAVKLSGSSTAIASSEQNDSVDRRHHIVEHDAEPSLDAPVDPADRPRLDDVKQPEQQEGDYITGEMRRHDTQHQPLRGDLVDDDGAGIDAAAGSRYPRSRPP